METLPDTTLRGAKVLFSVLNAQTNQYDQKGALLLVAMRKGGKVAMVLLNGNKPLMGIPITPSLDWALQNEVYCSFLDGNNNRFLLQFGKAEDASLFTAIAQYPKIFANQKSPLIITSGTGPQITGTFLASYWVYNMHVQAIESPVLQESDKIISISEDSPLKICAGLNFGSQCLCFYPPSSIAIVQISKDAPNISPISPKEKKENDSELFDKKLGELPSPQPTKEEVKPIIIQETKPQIIEDKKIEMKTPIKEVPKSEVKIHTPDISPKPLAETKSVLKDAQDAKKEVSKEEAPYQNKELNDMRNLMLDKFSAIQHQLGDIQKNRTANAPLQSMILVNSVQRLVLENEKKDKLIAEKQQLLDLLRTKKSDTRERDQLRRDLAELSSKAAAQKENINQAIKEKNNLEEQLKSLKEESNRLKSEKEKRMIQFRKLLEEEQQKELATMEQTKQQIQWKVKNAEDQHKLLSDQLNSLKQENERLKRESKTNSKEELQKLKDSYSQVIEDSLKRYANATYKMLLDAFDSSREYEGTEIIRAVKIALDHNAKELFEDNE